MIHVRNVTRNENIVVFNKIIEPNKVISINTEQLEELEDLIKNNKLKVEEIKVISSEARIETTNNKDDMQTRIMEAFFNLHFNKQLSNEQLTDLKWFFNHAGLTSKLDNATKSLLNDVNNNEELIEVLLNHLYPEMVSLYLKN